LQRTPRLYRRTREQGGILLGLCAGIGEHLGVDPVLVRLVLVLLTVLHYAGLVVILVYFLFGLLIPYSTVDAE
jgi:phage shock protein PspC (stress-responsive transcriptional regulator)